jgi:hypothetical protein
MDRCLRLVGLIALLSLLAGCPYSSDPGPADIQGTWTGTLIQHDGEQFPVVAAFIEDGAAFVYVPSTKARVAFLAFDPMRSRSQFSTEAINIPSDNCPDSPEHCLSAYGFVGSAYSDRMVLNVVDPCVTNSTLSCQPQQTFGLVLSRDQPYTGVLPAGAVPLPGTPGQWQGVYLNTDAAVVLDVSAGGSFTGTDAYGCALSGAVRQLGVDEAIGGSSHSGPQNLFAVTLDGAYQPELAKCAGQLHGVGYLSSTGTGPFKDVPGTYFFMGVYGRQIVPAPNLAYMVELKVD